MTTDKIRRLALDILNRDNTAINTSNTASNVLNGALNKVATQNGVNKANLQYTKATALLKTETEMRHDYGVANYPYDKSIYEYFIGLHRSTQRESIKPDVAALGKTLRDLFNSR